MLAILGILLLVELIILQSLLPGTGSRVKYESPYGFTCEVPEWRQTLEEGEGWQKHVFKGPGQLYLSLRSLDGDPETLMDYYRDTFIHPVFEAGIRVFDDGRFFISTFGRSGRRYIYLFSTGERFFWAEMTSPTSSLTTFKDILDQTVTSLSVGNASPGPEFYERARALDSSILLYAQSPGVLMGLMAGLPLIVVLAFMVPVYFFAGKLPDFKGRRPVRSAEDLFAWMRRPLGMSGTVVSLALFDDRLEVYNWRKARLVITPGSGSVERVSGKDRIVIKGGRLSVIVDLESPVWWLGEMSARGFRVERW